MLDQDHTAELWSRISDAPDPTRELHAPLPADSGAPANVLELRGADALARTSVLEGLRATPFEREFTDPGHADTVRQVAADMGMESNHAQTILAAAARHNSGTARPAEQQVAEALQRVKSQYGDDAQQMLELADRLVNRDPRVKAMVNRYGLGNDPDVVMTVIELARQERANGRLK